jgi:hypothetical protein
MTASSTSIRRPTTLLAALLTTLVIAPAAHAGPALSPDRADALGGANQTSHVVAVTPPDRADGLGGASFTLRRTAPPDRVDGLGSSRFTRVAAPTVILRSASSGFDWTSAVIGAVAGLGLALVAMAALLARGRRDVALPS